jgi:hypothetical protein
MHDMLHRSNEAVNISLSIRGDFAAAEGREAE